MCVGDNEATHIKLSAMYSVDGRVSIPGHPVSDSGRPVLKSGHPAPLGPHHDTACRLAHGIHTLSAVPDVCGLWVVCFLLYVRTYAYVQRR